MNKVFFCFSLMVACLCLSVGVMAQEPRLQKDSDIVMDPILGMTMQGEIPQGITNYRNNVYHDTTYSNLSKLYWAVGMHDLYDDDAIDRFLRINECDLYLKYYQDDFEWNEIRKATRKTIAEERATYPTKYEMLLPLSLSRYDLQRERFEVDEQTRFENMKKIDIALTSLDYTCYTDHFLEGYPGSVVMLLDQPFTLTTVPVKPEIADLYLQEAKQRYANMPDKVRLRHYEREAYLRVLVSFSSYVGTERAAGGRKLAVMHAKIDAIEVYADRLMTKPLYIKDFAELRRRNRVNVVDEALKNEVDKALGGLKDFIANDQEGMGSPLLQ